MNKPEQKTPRATDRKWRRAYSKVSPKSESYAGFQPVVPASSNTAKRLAEKIPSKVLRTFTDKIEGLERRVAQMEAKQKASENAYQDPQSQLVIRPRRKPPAGLTAMETVMGKLDIKESPEELLAMLKALD